jgi:hypothetical protein
MPKYDSPDNEYEYHDVWWDELVKLCRLAAVFAGFAALLSVIVY